MLFHALTLPRFAEDSRAYSAQQEEIPDKRDDVELWKSMSCHFDFIEALNFTLFSQSLCFSLATLAATEEVFLVTDTYEVRHCPKKFIFCFRETPSMKKKLLSRRLCGTPGQKS